MNINITAAPIPSTFRGTPQELLEAFLDRLKVEVDGIASLVVSDTEPSENQSETIWLKNGAQIWVWDETTTAYVPLDVSASVSDQIAVGASEPDSEEYKIWLKLDGTTVDGLYYYMGSSAGWVKRASDLTPGSVTSTILANNSVTRDKIVNGEVTHAKIQNDFPLTKLERGAANAVLRMRSDASAPEYSPLFSSTSEVVLTAGLMEVNHPVGAVPPYVRPVLVCQEDDAGYEVGDESMNLPHMLLSGETYRPAVSVDASKFSVRYQAVTLYLPHKGTAAQNTVITLSKWKLKFYYAAR